MSSKPVHYAAGVALAATLSYVGRDALQQLQILALAIGCLFGSSAPDWMEIAGWTFWGRRLSVIPHRTITHWLAGWSIVTAWAGWQAEATVGIEYYAGFGFALSALVHVLMDSRTSMGVPILHPFRRTRQNQRY